MSGKGSSLRDMLLSAEAALKAGDTARAVSSYAHILAKAPNHTKARHAVMKLRRAAGSGTMLTQSDVNAVVGLLGAGQFSEAADQARLLLVVAPKEALVHNILGMALASDGTPREAISAFQNAVRINPAYAEAHGNLGSAWVQLERFDKALPSLKKALSINKNLPEALNNLALVERHDGQFNQALLSINKALTLRADYANALNTKGTILLKLGRAPEAITCYKKGLELQPDDGDLMMNLGFAYEDVDDPEKAITALLKAQPRASNPAEVDHRLGVIYGQLGDKTKAVAYDKAAIARDPTLAEAYRTLSLIYRFEHTDPLIAQMKDLIGQKDGSDDAQMHLGFALGKALEDCGDYGAAFENLMIGNREKRKQVLPYSTDMQRQLIETIKSTFTPEFIASLKPVATNSDQPIFIVGMNRSGTTLVEQILATHSQVFGAGEQIIIDKFGQDNIDHFATLPHEAYREFASAYLAKMKALSQGEPYITDKMPVNFQWIGLIAGLFPNAKIINLRRDPRDNCLSIWRNYFSSGGNQYAYDLTELAEFYGLYREMMAHWDDLFPGRILTLSYEDLTRNQETESRKLLAFCGLDWEDAVLEFYTSRRTVKTASVGQVRQKMYTSSVKSWKRYEQQLAPLFHILDAAGYLPKDEDV